MPESRDRSGSRAPLLVLVSGLPGVGKSLLVQALAPRLGAAILSRDAARLGLESGSLRRLVEVLVWRFAGRRLASTQRRAGRALQLATAQQLQNGRSVLVEAVAEQSLREWLRELAVEHGATFVQVECVLSDPAEHRRRLVLRPEGERFWRSVVTQIDNDYRPPADSIRIDTMAAPADLAEQVLALVVSDQA